MKPGQVFIDNAYRKRDRFDTFIQLTGPKQDVTNFAEAICGSEYREQLSQAIAKMKEEDTYVSLCMKPDAFEKFERAEVGGGAVDIRVLVASFAPLVEKYYRCEFFYYWGGAAKNKPNAIYFMSLAGEKTISDMMYFYIPDSPDIIFWFEEHDYITMLFNGKYIDAMMTVNLKNGKEYHYIDEMKHEWKYDAVKAVEPFFTSKLSLDKLADMVCDYKAPKKRQEFFQNMKNAYQSIDQISSITVTQKKMYPTNWLESEKVCDPTVMRYLDTMLVENQEIVFDFTTNTAKKKCVREVVAYADPLHDDFTRENIPFEENEETVEIPGLEDAEELLFVFGADDKYKMTLCGCLTDAETIVVPDTVRKIAKGAFSGLKNVKEIILPDELWEIARGAFAGCKNLERIRFAGKSKTYDSLVFKDGDKLQRYISGQETYVVPDTVRALDNYVFEDCNRLKKVVLHGKMKRLPNHALDKCKTLTVLEIGEGLKKINTHALENSKIKEIILPTGSVKIFDKYQYQFLLEGKQTVAYDFADAAKNVTRMLAEPATAALAGDKSFKIAEDMVKHHAEEVGDQLPALVTAALCYSIAQGDLKKLTSLLKNKQSGVANRAALSACADEKGDQEILALLKEKELYTLERDAADEAPAVTLKEMPAQKGRKNLYIKVKFPDNKAYNYFCKFEVNVGDKVFVEGKRAGMPGTVAEIIDKKPTGRAASYTLDVTEAFNMVEE